MLAPFFEIQVRDIVDILVVASLLYLATVWIRRAQAALVAGGILVLGVLYVTARLLDLRLTTWIFQGFFAVLLIILVVVFQEELRQFFERLAVWSLRRTAATPHRFSEVLVRCLSDFSRDRIGALVVLPGRQPLGRHLDGGVELGGKLSMPLLKSLFDPNSPGHDGALLIEGNRITRFGVQLPLSKDFRQLPGMGTRHGAALGLAELSDAMCLVVSEERGTISIAHQGRLLRAMGPQEVGQAIDAFVHARQPPPNRAHIIARLLRENWLERILAVVLAFGLWYALVPGARVVQNSYWLPVTVMNLPDGLELEYVDPPKVEVNLGGPARAFYLFDPGELAVTIDVTLAQWGRRTFQIAEHNVRHPSELTLHRIEPSTIKISVMTEEGLMGPEEQDRSARGTAPG